MVTVVYRVVAKEGKDKEFKQIALKCVECAYESKDCLYYTFFRSLTDPREFMVYYKFTNKEAQDRHIENLGKKIGPARQNRDLPENFLRLLDEEELIWLVDDDVQTA